jgi:hypothetical protein
MKTLRLYGAGLLVALLLTLAAHGSSSPNFTLSLNPTSLTVQQGSSGTTRLTITPQGGFTGTVSLSLVGAPSGVTLLPTSVSVTGSSPVTRNLTVSVGSGVATGAYNLQVRATSGSLTKTAGLSLTVTASGGGGGGGGGSGVGTTWTLRNLGNPLYGVTYGNGTFVAGGRRRHPHLPGRGDLDAADLGDGLHPQRRGLRNGLFVAVGWNGAILTSPDGVSWTRRTSGTSDTLWDVAYGNGTFVVVGRNGTILTSPDGVSWTAQTSPTSNDLYAVTYGNGLFVAVGWNGAILTSPDGVNWTQRTSETVNGLNGVTYGNGTFVAVCSYGTILTSP